MRKIVISEDLLAFFVHIVDLVTAGARAYSNTTEFDREFNAEDRVHLYRDASFLQTVVTTLAARGRNSEIVVDDDLLEAFLDGYSAVGTRRPEYLN